MTSAFLSRLRRLKRAQDGVAALELALLLPVLILLLMGAFEVPRSVLIYQKVARTSSEIGDLVARQDVITPDQLTDLYQAADEIMTPFTFKTYGTIIISSITQADSTSAPVIAWQCSSDATLLLSSKFGKVGDKPVLPTDFTVGAGSNVIIAEVYYKYTPVFSQYVYGSKKMFSPATFYDSVFFRPRSATQISLNGKC